MLGTLAKWLRICGYDTEYAHMESDDEIIEKAKEEGRIIITRDKELFERCKNAILVENKGVEEQLRKVLREASINIEEKNILTRCTLCNVPVEEIKKEKVKEKVPPHAYESHDEFWICPKCKRIYWMGTHWKNMEKMIKKIESP